VICLKKYEVKHIEEHANIHIRKSKHKIDVVTQFQSGNRYKTDKEEDKSYLLT